MSNPPTRREVLKELSKAAGVAGVGMLGANVAAQTTSTTSASAPTSSPTPSPTTQAASDLTVADLAAADRVAGRSAYSDAEREMMLGSVRGKREVMVALRAASPEIHPVPQSLMFAALPPPQLPQGPSVCEVSDAPLIEVDNNNLESLAFASVAELSRLIQARKITSLAITQMFLKRLREIGPRLNCLITLTEELALSQAKQADAELSQGHSRGPLHGIPYGIKDLAATRQYPTTWGIELYKDRVLDHDATFVKRLAAAGAVLIGKLSLGELCMGDVWFGGSTRTPWKPSEGSSGSSAGPCAAVAAGLCAFAIGSETLGSIVSPCTVNGTTGLRPTFGRVSRAGCMSLSFTMDKLGPITRGVEDAALVFNAIRGRDDEDRSTFFGDVPFSWQPSTFDSKNLRVGYDPAAFDFESEGYRKNPATAEVARAAFESIRDMVGSFTPITLPGTAKYKGLASLTIACESACEFTDLLTSGDIHTLKQQHEGAWPNAFRAGSTVPASDYLLAMKRRTQLQQEMAAAMKDVDLYVTMPYVGPTLAFTNLTGHPSLVTRCGIVDGRPRLIEFIGQPLREDQILGLAFAYERKHEWGKARPDVAAIPAVPS